MNKKKIYMVIDEKKFNGRWPFTKKRVMIQKNGFSLYVRVNNKKYCLNGVAKDGRPLDEIWKPDKKTGAMVSVSDVIDLAIRELR
jgi:hypothetical protein